MARRLRGWGAVLLALSVLGSSGVAFAHVTVQPTAAPPGSATTLTFRVPTERADASTVKVVLALPTAPRVSGVAVQPTPGWRAQLSATRVTWTAADPGSAIGPGQFQQFVIAADALPNSGPLIFKVLQYYSDGSVVRWIDPPRPGDELPHPAPVVAIRRDTAPPAGDDSEARWIAVAAFVAGLIGLACGSAALVAARRGNRRTP